MHQEELGVNRILLALEDVTTKHQWTVGSEQSSGRA